MGETETIKNLNNYFKPISDKKIKRGNILLFVNNYLDFIESIPTLSIIIETGSKDHQKKIDKMMELESKIKSDIDNFYQILLTVLKEEGLFDINDPKYKEVLTIKEIRDVYLIEPPYNLPDIEAFMLYQFLTKKEDWISRYWYLKNVVNSLVKDEKEGILQKLLSIQKTSETENLVSKFYQPYHTLWQRRYNDLGAIWKSLEEEKPYFINFTTKRLREQAEALHCLIKIKYQDSREIESEANPKSLPKDILPPKIENGKYILGLKEGKKIEINNQKPSCTYFKLTLKNLGQLTSYQKAFDELKMEKNKNSKKRINNLVETLKRKFINNGLSNRFTYTSVAEKGYILNILEKVDE